VYALAANKLKAKPGIPRVLSQLNQAEYYARWRHPPGRARTNESLKQLGIMKDFSVIVAGEK